MHFGLEACGPGKGGERELGSKVSAETQLGKKWSLQFWLEILTLRVENLTRPRHHRQIVEMSVRSPQGQNASLHSSAP